MDAKILAESTTIDELNEDFEKKTKLTTTKTEKFLTDALESFTDIVSEVDSRLSRKTTFQLCGYQTDQFTSENIEKVCGNLVMKDMIVALSERKSQFTGKCQKIFEKLDNIPVGCIPSAWN